MRKLLNLVLRLVRGKNRPMPWEHGPKIQKQNLKASDLPRDQYGRWIVDGGEPNDWHYQNRD
jgi:hypothetical protein